MTRRRRDIAVGGALAACLQASRAASATENAPVGPEIGLRVGYAVPAGDQYGSSDPELGNRSMRGDYAGQVPFWIDLGYRLLPSLAVSAFVQYDVVNPTGATSPCLCGVRLTSGNGAVFGLEAMYHFLPLGPIDPWAGLGFGYEYTTLRGQSGTQASDSLRGWQLLNLQIGADYLLAPRVGAGPFASFSLGQYSVEWGDYGQAGPVPAGRFWTSLGKDPTFDKLLFHEWFTFGVRGVYDLRL
jgi:hypothetical protein